MKKTRKIENYFGFDYVNVTVPVRNTKFGEVIDMDLAAIEKYVARQIISEQRPIHGLEVLFFRKTLGLSMGRFGAIFGLSGSAILKWEREPAKRLDAPNEIAVRSFVAEELGVPLVGSFSKMIGVEQDDDMTCNVPQRKRA